MLKSGCHVALQTFQTTQVADVSFLNQSGKKKTTTRKFVSRMSRSKALFRDLTSLQYHSGKFKVALLSERYSTCMSDTRLLSSSLLEAICLVSSPTISRISVLFLNLCRRLSVANCCLVLSMRVIRLGVNSVNVCHHAVLTISCPDVILAKTSRGCINGLINEKWPV